MATKLLHAYRLTNMTKLIIAFCNFVNVPTNVTCDVETVMSHQFADWLSNCVTLNGTHNMPQSQTRDKYLPVHNFIKWASCSQALFLTCSGRHQFESWLLHQPAKLMSLIVFLSPLAKCKTAISPSWRAAHSTIQQYIQSDRYWKHN
jgi:hypothetical protein